MINSPRIKNKIIPALLVSIGFLFIDALWISALPILNISHGPILPTIFIFFMLRTASFGVWFLLLMFVPKWRSSSKMSFLILLIFVPNILLLGLGIYGFYIEPFRLTVNQIEVPVAGLQKTIRIVQLSDLHVEQTTKREQAIPSLVENLNPDMIVLTGDFLIESRFNFPVTIEALKDLVDQFHAPLGVYAVNGNVETPARLKDLFQGLDVHVLNNEIIRLPEISDNFVLIGLSFHNWSYDSNQLSRLMKNLQPDDYSLLLYHKPDLAYAAEEEGVDLYLAGHTHGGQVRLPFYGAIYANSHYGKTFEMGLYHLANTTLYVNRGLGFTGGSAPRVRFLAPPEVLIVDLVPE